MNSVNLSLTKSQLRRMGLCVLLVGMSHGCSERLQQEPEDMVARDGGSAGEDSHSDSGGDVQGTGAAKPGRPETAGGGTGGKSHEGEDRPDEEPDGMELGGMGGEMASGDPDHPVPDATLKSLTVAGVVAGLTPEFSPDIHRYSVRATEALSALSVTASAAARLDITIDGEPYKANETTVLEDASVGDEIEISVLNDDGDEAIYTIVYLPYGFPELTVRRLEPEASTDPIYVTLHGYGGNFVAKLDNHGVPLVWFATELQVDDFKRHANGWMSYANSHAQERLIFDQNFQEVDRVTSVGLSAGANFHDFLILDNGNYALIAYELTQRDMTEFGLSENQNLQDGIIQEVTPQGQLVFQWNTWDHMRYDESLELAEKTADYAHLNAIEIGPDGNWLVSSRFMSQVLKVHRTTGEVIWRLGGIANDFAFIDDPYGGPCGQHTPTWVGENRILIFDNGRKPCYPARKDNFTRVTEYEIDEEAMTARLVWSVNGPYSQWQGSAQRLANGHTFVGWGTWPNEDFIMATEFDGDGNVLFELKATQLLGTAVRGIGSYRAYRFPE